jgi:hypothetical protein
MQMEMPGMQLDAWQLDPVVHSDGVLGSHT